MTRRHIFAFLVPLFVLLVANRVNAEEVDPSLDAFFRRTATLEGKPYALARDQLVRRGEAVLPLAEKYTNAEDWRHWRLAEVLRLHITRPEAVALWRFAITHWKVDLRKDGNALRAHFDAAFANIAEQQGVKLPNEPIELPPEIVPIALELLCEHKRLAGNGHTYEMGVAPVHVAPTRPHGSNRSRRIHVDGKANLPNAVEPAILDKRGGSESFAGIQQTRPTRAGRHRRARHSRWSSRANRLGCQWPLAVLPARAEET